MTNRYRFVTFSVPDPTGPIEPDFTLASPPAGRTFRRRRLGLLTGVLALTLGTGGLLSDGSGSRDTAVAAGGPRDGSSVLISESEGSATLAAVFAETTSTLVAVTSTTMAETTTTAVPSTSTTSSSTAAAPTTSTTAAPATTEPPTTGPPTTATTTAAPTTAPPTTAAPTTTVRPRSSPSTTAAPESSRDSSYSDPDTLQVWLDLADCESGGNWSIDTGNGYYGGLQFSLGTWESVGGSGYPHEHPRDTQIELGRRLQARDGWGAWPHCSEKLGLR